MATDPGPVVSLKQVVGGGYDEFMRCTKPYCIVKGSRGSKKSTTAALKIIAGMTKYPLANTLAVRRYSNALKDSVFAELIRAINRLQLQDHWTYTTNPLQITNKDTGQVILFRGLDEAQKLTSINVTKGFLCWVWIEEAYQITDKDAFDKLDFSIRGQLPPGYYKQIIMTFNPWSERTWIKSEFFDEYIKDPDTGEPTNEKKDMSKIFTMTTTYRVNEFLSDENRAQYEKFAVEHPRAAKVVCDGEWGVSEGLIYPDYTIDDFDRHAVFASDSDNRLSYGLDFGYSTSYNAFVEVIVNPKRRKIWVCRELYAHHQNNVDLAGAIVDMGCGKEVIWADSAAPQSISELRSGTLMRPTGSFDENGKEIIEAVALPNIRGVMKGADSVSRGIQTLQSYDIIIHSSCINVIGEIQAYSWEKDRDGVIQNKPCKINDHLMDAIRYAIDWLIYGGKGYVGVAAGGRTGETKYKAKRVFSTI